MSLPGADDLSGLASLAHDPGLDLRPVLLRVQTDLFLAASTRTPAMIAAFEALVCGLLPTVDDTLASRIAHKLARCPDTPDRVMSALVERGGEARYAVVAATPHLSSALAEGAVAVGGDLAGALAQRSDVDAETVVRLLDLPDDGVDFALAMNRAVSLPARAVDELLMRARTRPALAQAMLARGDLSGPEEAALYDHADASRRMQIRARLEPFAALRRGSGRRLAADEAAELLDCAAWSKTAFEERLARLFGFPTTPDWRFERPERHELLALSLAALGVRSEDAIRIFLTLEPAIARSITAVLQLAGVARTVSQPLAATLVEAILGRPVAARRAGRHAPAMDPSGTADRGSRAAGERARVEKIVRLVG